MGLAARRAIEDFKVNSYPKLKKEIDGAACFPVEMDVHWDTLNSDSYSHLLSEGLTKVFFTPIVNAFKDVCRDEMGKKALKDSLKKVIVHGDESYSPNNWTFENGTLTLCHNPFTNIDDIDLRSKCLIDLLEKNL